MQVNRRCGSKFVTSEIAWNASTTFC